MAEKVKTADTYEIGTEDVFLSLNIGEGQFGTSDVFVEDTSILRASGSIGRLRLGAGIRLTGKDVLIRSVVTDVSTLTNKMSVTYLLSGGKKDKKIAVKSSVSKPGASLVFETTFALS